jgi:hypothetical protein
VQSLEIDRRFRGPGTPFEEIDGAFQELRFPLRDLGWIHIKLCGKSRQRLVTLDDGQCDLGPKDRWILTRGDRLLTVVLHIGGAYHAPIKQEIHLIELFRLVRSAH